MPKVLILIADDASFEAWHYFLQEIARVWQQRGVEVTIQRGPGDFVPADVAISHVDLTIVPPDHQKFLNQYPRVINGAASDISKRRVSRNLLSRTDRYDGPVIVKTNSNSGGWRERVRKGAQSPLRRVSNKIRRQLPWSFRAELGQYRILPSIQHVPWPVWHNPDLVVERYLCERQGDLYGLRTWVFFGDQETNSLSLSNQAVVKLDSVVSREPIPEVPQELRDLRRQLGFDFGKFDYGIIDGRPVLYDANRTPTLGRMPPEQYLPRIRLLARRLNVFLPKELAVSWD